MLHTPHSRHNKGVALVSLCVALLASACGSSSKSSATTTAAAAPAVTTPAAGGTTAPAAGGAIKKGLKVYFIPKDTLNPYEVIADDGGTSALKELGGTVVVSSGTEDTAAAQIPSIQAAIADKADAIVIAGNDPDALCPSLAQAQAAGIKVVAFDSDVSCPDHLFINQADTEGIGRSQVDLLAGQIGSTGEIAILSAAATATNQNAWIDFMKKQLADKYPNMKLVDVVYGNDDPATSLTVLQGLLSAHPNLKGIISPTNGRHLDSRPVLLDAQGPRQEDRSHRSGACRRRCVPTSRTARSSRSRCGIRTISAISPGTPQRRSPRACSPSPTVRSSPPGKLKDYTVSVPATGSPNVVLGLPQVFDASNIDNFQF